MASASNYRLREGENAPCCLPLPHQVGAEDGLRFLGTIVGSLPTWLAWNPCPHPIRLVSLLNPTPQGLPWDRMSRSSASDSKENPFVDPRMFPLLLRLNTWGMSLAEDSIQREISFFFKVTGHSIEITLLVPEAWTAANAPATGKTLPVSSVTFSWADRGPHYSFWGLLYTNCLIL